MWEESHGTVQIIRWRANFLSMLFMAAVVVSTGCGGGNLATFQNTSRTLTVQPQAVNFGTAGPQASVAGIVNVKNVSPTSVTLLSASTTPGFYLANWAGPVTLAPQESMQLQLRFAPFVVGTYEGFLQIRSRINYGPVLNGTRTFGAQTNTGTTFLRLSGASSNQAVDGGGGTGVAGTVAGHLAVTPGTLDFGSVLVGQRKSLTAILGAKGSTVIVYSATPSTSEFTVSGPSLPLIIAAGQTATFTVTFSPQASGTTTATVSFASNASNSLALDSLTGTGIPPAQHSVDLSWDSSASSSVVGYNVYRSMTSGGPYIRINSILEASTTYTDATVRSGAAYYYVTTAVDGKGLESIYSNEVSAVIPLP